MGAKPARGERGVSKGLLLSWLRMFGAVEDASRAVSTLARSARGESRLVRGTGSIIAVTAGRQHRSRAREQSIVRGFSIVPD